MNFLTAQGVSSLLREEGISLSGYIVEKLVLHAEEMLRWNKAVRLTAITAPEEVTVKHILDSLLLLPFSPFPGRTLDFGSGAGYPGIPLAAALPEARVLLLESSAKKCAFLSHACAMLGLRNAEVIRGRLTANSRLSIGSFEQIVTRATLPPREAAGLLVPHLTAEGRLLLMTGPGRDQGSQGESVENPPVGKGLPPGCECTRRERFTLPMGMGCREILEIKVRA